MQEFEGNQVEHEEDGRGSEDADLEYALREDVGIAAVENVNPPKAEDAAPGEQADPVPEQAVS